MSRDEASAAAVSTNVPNGSGAAAVLAAGIGALALAVIAIAADRIAWMKSAMVFYRPTGPLSGVTTSAIFLWLVVWAVLESRWRKKEVAMRRIGIVAFALLALGLLLTFPPVADLF
jgi:hypothetical protein